MRMKLIDYLYVMRLQKCHEAARDYLFALENPGFAEFCETDINKLLLDLKNNVSKCEHDRVESGTNKKII